MRGNSTEPSSAEEPHRNAQRRLQSQPWVGRGHSDDPTHADARHRCWLRSTASRENRRPRGYASWRPQTKTRALLASVEEVLDRYFDHLPLTVRQIFYSLVGSYAYEKTERAYGRLAEHLVRARRARLIPFEAIRDDGVVTYSSPWHGSPADFWDDVGHRIRSYRRDRQAGQPRRMELWCESVGMAPQLARVADRYSVPVFSSGGFASLTAVRLIVDRAIERDVPTVLLHVGDLDPSGEAIFGAMASDAAAFVQADRVIGSQRIEAARVALTPEQVEEYGLPTAPPKPTDVRSRRWRGETCQVEALPPDDLAAVIDGAIRSRLRLDLLEHQIEDERADRAELWRGLPEGESA
jgi:hypothetical protein